MYAYGWRFVCCTKEFEYKHNMYGITLLAIHQSVPALCRELGSHTLHNQSLSLTCTYMYTMYEPALLTDLHVHVYMRSLVPISSLWRQSREFASQGILFFEELGSLRTRLAELICDWELKLGTLVQYPYTAVNDFRVTALAQEQEDQDDQVLWFNDALSILAEIGWLATTKWKTIYVHRIALGTIKCDFPSCSMSDAHTYIVFLLDIVSSQWTTLVSATSILSFSAMYQNRYVLWYRQPWAWSTPRST